MRKLKLLFTGLALVGGVLSASAEDVFKDVTSTYLTNADFEGTYTVHIYPTSSGTNKRAVYKPDGWTVSYTNGNQYDNSALDDKCLYWSNFSSLATAPDCGSKTYWIRLYNDSEKGQRLEISQTVTLKGTFVFSSYAYFNNTGYGTAYIQINSSSNRTSVSSNESWGQISKSFTNTTEASTTLTCGAWHKQKTGHAIVGFDNVKLEWNLTQSLTDLLSEANTFYDANTSYTALKTVIEATNVSETDPEKLETQYNNLSAALALARAQKQWQETWNELNGLDKEALPNAAKNAITTELAKDVPTTTAEAVNTAKGALQDLIDSYAGIKAAYDKVNDLISLATSEKTNSAGDKDDINDAITTAESDKEDCINVSGLTSVYNALETVRQAYVTSGAEPADGYPFECTFKISNPGFEADGKETNSPTGWTIPNKGNQYGAKSRGSVSNMTGSYMFNNWQSWWMDCNVEQTISSLPKGRYEVTAVLASYSGTSANLQAGDGSTDRNMTGENNGISVSVNGDVTSSSLTIRARAGRKNDGSLLRADDFTLSFIGLKPVLNDLISSATTLSTQNVGEGVFQIPASAAETLSSAIETAQGVYDDASKYGDDIQGAIDALNTAIETFQAAELNVPDAEKRYYLKVATADHAKEGNAVVMGLGATSENNPTGYTYKASATPASYLAQAFTFTQVSGNTYKIQMGSVYLTNGTNNGSAAGWKASQIQGTTDASKAMTFTIEAADVANTFYIYNSETNSTIACQVEGNLYTEAGNAYFTLEEASQASVPVTIAADVKLATRIFPFKPTLPEGVKAYSCNAVDDIDSEYLKLEEVADPEANVPYILYAEDGYSGDALTGWGTAIKDCYDAGWLYGVYTSRKATAGTYVLQKHESEVAFYQVADGEGQQPTVGAYRCYLSGVDGARALYFNFDETTAVETIQALTAGKNTIYNVAGKVVPSLQKGLNIIKTSDGKIRKVIVKK